MTTQRTCQTCAAFNPAPLQDEPTYWNFVSIDSRQPAAGDACPDHLDSWEDGLIDAALEGLPFDATGEKAPEQLAARMQAMNNTRADLHRTRSLVAKVIAKARI